MYKNNLQFLKYKKFLTIKTLEKILILRPREGTYPGEQGCEPHLYSTRLVEAIEYTNQVYALATYLYIVERLGKKKTALSRCWRVQSQPNTGVVVGTSRSLGVSKAEMSDCANSFEGVEEDSPVEPGGAVANRKSETEKRGWNQGETSPTNIKLETVSTPTPDNAFHMNQPHKADGKAMGEYRENYTYDPAGNITEVKHLGIKPKNNGWTRSYFYQETSELEPNQKNNRLSKTRVGEIDYPLTYDAHGNMTSMPHLHLMQWDDRDQLKATSGQAVSSGTPETTYYVYDFDGMRTRKVTENQATEGQTPTRKSERLYMDSFEIFREYEADGTTIKVERETLHIRQFEVDDATEEEVKEADQDSENENRSEEKEQAKELRRAKKAKDDARVAIVERRTKGKDKGVATLTRYQLNDHLGTVAVELTDKGWTLSYEEYSPYGTTTIQTNRSNTHVPKRYRFTGKERDGENGLSYHGARYLAPWLGRWVSSDKEKGGTQHYIYSFNNPIQFKDPDGNFAFSAYGQGTVQYYQRFAKGAKQEAIDIAKGAYGLYERTVNAFLSPITWEDAPPSELAKDVAQGVVQSIKDIPKIPEKIANIPNMTPEEQGAGALNLGLSVPTGGGGGKVSSSIVKNTIKSKKPGSSLFRGVSANHPEIESAKKGKVVPGNPDGDVTPELHNLGGFAADSPYTSWTRDRNIAIDHARQDGDGGVLLELTTGAPKSKDSWSWEIVSPDEFFEQEILLKGTRKGAKVRKINNEK